MRAQIAYAQLTVEILISILTSTDPTNLRRRFLDLSPLL